MGFVAHASAVFLTAVILHSLSMGQGDVIRSCDLEVIKPGNQPCQEICPAIYDPVCVVGIHVSLITFPNRCEASYFACDEREVLWVIRNGPCPCKSRVHRIHHC